MSTFKDGITVGGSFVIQHQKEETMAAVLLAGEGEYTVMANLFSFKFVVIITGLKIVFCTSGEGVCLPVR